MRRRGGVGRVLTDRLEPVFGGEGTRELGTGRGRCDELRAQDESC
jgi:hypothetical protein